jgi:hypothetical protein
MAVLLHNQLKKKINMTPVTGSCEHGNELQDFMKDRNFLDQLSNYLLHK